VHIFKDFSLSAITAGFVTVLVGYTSSVAIIFQATTALNATPAQTASWMWALGIGMGITCIGLSLRYRQPVVTAWSTPGAAVLVTAAAGATMEQAIGAFIVSAALVLLFGITGWFEKLMSRIPMALASALLAGVLARFAMDGFAAVQTNTGLVLAMFITYLLAKKLLPRYAVIAVLIVGVLWAAAQGQLSISGVQWQITQPVWTTPAFSLSAIIGIAVPLFVVTMASQNMPGVAAQRACGYSTPVSPVIAWTGAATLVLAPFGAFALSLAAITAAICMGKEAHEDPARRYTASIAAGVMYCLLGVFGATIAGLLAAFPKALVLALAGLALLGTIASGLAGAMKDEPTRDAAIITFIVTLSGLTLFGVGSAFWGVVAGSIALFVSQWRLKKSDTMPS
jgi:benzoate membrane transport protein